MKLKRVLEMTVSGDVGGNVLNDKNTIRATVIRRSFNLFTKKKKKRKVKYGSRKLRNK